MKCDLPHTTPPIFFFGICGKTKTNLSMQQHDVGEKYENSSTYANIKTFYLDFLF